MKDNFGFVKCAAASPKLKVANTEYNSKEIVKIVNIAYERDTKILVFPELCITGYTCGDLFNQKYLIDKSLDALINIAKATKDIDTLVFVGLPMIINGNLYNCAAAIQYGEIKGIIPKLYLANYNEFYEKRWFTSGKKIINKIDKIKINGKYYPFGNIIFENEQLNYRVGVEICEDLWVPIPRSSYLSLNGANIIVNLSASNELVSKSEYRRQLISNQCSKILTGYIYSSSGVYESTTDLVFGGDCVICESGSILNASQRFKREGEIIYSDIDIDRINHDRTTNISFSDSLDEVKQNDFQIVSLNEQTYKNGLENVDREITRHPFVPNDPRSMHNRCEEIFNIQVAGLAKRIEHTKMNHAVIGISGGLDSTLALLVTYQTFELLNLPKENIIGVTMPGFGTTDHTYNSAVDLMKSMSLTIKEIDIREACLKHFDDIEHDPELYDVTYENVQARERTQILMDLANKHNGLVIGTGDLSELALGWATYNGDHMSMYGVNCGVPKTLVRFLVKWVADNKVDNNTRDILYRVLDTPISPELLPPDKEGKIAQKTESIIGPYELHDFFLFYTIRYGFKPKKLLFIAAKAFDNIYTEEEIKKYLRYFYRRFFTQQFKRSCIPDGPKVGTVSLSPRGDWRMPSDADYEIWIKELE